MREPAIEFWTWPLLQADIEIKFLCAFASSVFTLKIPPCKRAFSSAPPAAARPSAVWPKCAPRLRDNPAGAPLILLAPKQATFQLERQLLADEKISGYTRLQILSFDRLARFVFEKLRVAAAPTLVRRRPRSWCCARCSCGMRTN